jgi:dTDP-4-dehydrorhamnose 3,5-epimerase-like enzyme
MSLIKKYNLSLLGDERGSLVVMDQLSGVPLDIKRLYYIFDTKKGVSRGFHAHKLLHQVAVCVSGSCRMILDDGVIRESIRLDSPCMALDVPPMLWHEMHDFSNNCVLLMIASDIYDESDYIRDYDEFKKAAE